MARVIYLILAGVFLFGCSQSQIKISGNLDQKTHLNQTGNLAEILSDKDIEAEYLLLIAADGTAVFLSERSLGEIRISKSGKTFNSRSDVLPPVCSLNDLKEICIYFSNYPLTDHQTPFSLRMQDFRFLGESSQSGHYVRKYKLKGSQE